MICYQYAPAADGGAERQAQRLAEALASGGYAVGVVTTRLPGTPRRQQLAGVEVHRVWTVWRRGWVSLTFLPSLVIFLVLHGRRFDVWHVHQAYYHYLVALLLARVLGKRCVVKAAASGPFGDIARLRASKLGGVVLRAIPSADAVVSLNRELSSELEHAGVDGARARVIRNGVDLHAFTPPTSRERQEARTSLGLTIDAVVVAFVGRLTHEKGVHVLLDAWGIVEEADSTGRCRLLLAGDGEEAAVFQRRATSELHRVTFLGRLLDVRSLLRAADILVLPSLSEGLSNAVLEAMAMAIPVVATRIGGLEEQVADGVTGVLVAPGNAGALADGLDALIRDAHLQRAMGERGRASVEQRFSFASTLDAYQQLYQDLIA
jgi:glycosyltransferase involved in cell wall biosynthesis